MSHVIDHVSKKPTKTSAILLEIDYELVTLFDAIQADNKSEICETKEILATLVKELNSIYQMEGNQ